MADNNTRLSRDLSTRDKAERKKVWKPAGTLPDPNPQDGYGFRWIRKSLIGTSDPMNMSKNLRQGWEPVNAKDHPELVSSLEADVSHTGLVEFGGLILCKMPLEMIDQRNKYYAQITQNQMTSVDSQLMSNNDARMPLFNERKTKVTFGSGS